MTFTEYFENLAKRHVDVRHGHRGEMHYLSSEDEKHTALDSLLCYPAIIIDRGTGFEYKGQPGAYTKNRDYLILVLDHVSDTSDYLQIERTLNKCESIFEHCINQLYEDKRNRKLKLSFELEDVEADYVRNNDNQLYGIAASVLISEPYTPKNCTKAFLLDRSFDETFDETFQ